MQHFVETPIFTRQLVKLMPDEEYRVLQWSMVLRPAQGKVIPGSGGLRKLRWQIGARGKRGGVRIIYWLGGDTVFLLLVYRKADQADLTAEQVRILRKFVREELA
jgi:hypothetical protein